MEEMRRKDREVTELETVKEIIRQCDVLRLGLADGDYPYIVPMNFGWEEKEGAAVFLPARGSRRPQGGAAAAKRGLFLPDGLWPPGSAAAGARHYHTVRLRNGQGDCYPADRGRKAPGHAAFD